MPPNSVMRQASDGHPPTGSPQTSVFTRMTTNPRVGFKTKWLPYVNVNRVAGETKWSFWSLLLYSIDGIVAFSTAPLSLAALTGIVFCLIAILA